MALHSTLSNRFLTSSFDEDHSFLTITWLSTTFDMTPDEYKSVFMEIANFIETQQVAKWMGYTKDFAFVVSPDLQEWLAGEFNQKLVDAGLKKMALIIPTDYIANLAVQQSIDEMANNMTEEAFETRYFDNPDNAKKWLME